MASIPYVFAVRDNAATPPGTRKTGLTPTWVFLKALADLSDLAAPAIVEIADGQYGFAFDAEALGEAAGQIDAGGALANPADRYLDVLLTKDSSRVQLALPNAAPGSTQGGLPTCRPGIQADGATIAQAVRIAETEKQALAVAIWSYLKSAAAALGTTTFGRFIYDRLSRIPTSGAITLGPTVNNPGAIYIGADYPSMVAAALELTATGKPDMTGRPLALGLGVDVASGKAIVVVAGGVVVSGAPGDQVVRFEPTRADTERLRQYLGDIVKAVAFCDFSDGAGGTWRVPVASTSYVVRSLFDAVP